MTTYCALCNLVVAPQEPNRIKVGNLVAHKSCLLKRQVETHSNGTPGVPPVRKTRFPFFSRRR